MVFSKVLIASSFCFFGFLTTICKAESFVIPKDLFVVTESLPPYQIVKADNTVEGIATDKVKMLLTNLQLEPTIHAMPWARAYQTAISRPNTLIYSIVRTPEREKLFQWIGVLESTKTYLIALKKRKDIKVNKLNDLLNYQVGVKRNDVVFQYLSHKNMLSSIVVLPETFATIQMLLKERADIIAASPPHLEYICKQLNCKMTDFTFLLELDELSVDFYLAASKQTPVELVKRMQNTLSKINDLSEER